MIKVYTHFDMSHLDVEPFLMRAFHEAIIHGHIVKHDFMHVVMSDGQAMRIPDQSEVLTLKEGIYGRLKGPDKMAKPSGEWVLLGAKDALDDICEYLAHMTPEKSRYETLVGLVEGNHATVSLVTRSRKHAHADENSFSFK